MSLLHLKPAAPTARQRTLKTKYIWPIVLMASYQWFLCFVSTNLFSTPSSLVAVVEATILAGTALLVLQSKNARDYFVLSSAIFTYFCLLMAFRGQVDFQDIRDVLLPLTFFFLGKTTQNKELLDQAFWRLACFVVAGAFLEYVLTDIYLHFFNIQHYYIDRGLINGSLDYLNSDVLFNGERFSGRNILPFLGNQRISSIFLEPVSMGNFAVLLAAWGLSFPHEERKRGYRHLVMAAIFIVASDSRFGSLMVIALVVVKSISLLQHRFILPFLPLVAVMALLSAYCITPKTAALDTLPGRIVRSGQALYDLTFTQWIGIGRTEPLGDAGIAYTIEHLGLLMAAFLAVSLTMLPLARGQAATFRALAAHYATAILMISGTSFYSAKTSALLWFALGNLYAVGRTPHMQSSLRFTVSSSSR